MIKLHKLIIRLFALGFLVFIFYILFLANTKGTAVFSNITTYIPYGDKVGHCFLYGFLSWVFIIFTQYRTVQIKRLPVFWGTLIALLLTTLEEGSQLFLSTRTFDWMDLLANTIGIGIAALTILIFQKTLKYINDKQH